MIEAQLPEELRVFLSLPRSAVMADRVRFRALGNTRVADRKHRQSAILFRALLLISVFMTPAYGPGYPLWRVKGDETDGSVTRRSRALQVGSWPFRKRPLIFHSEASVPITRYSCARCRAREVGRRECLG